MSEENCTVTLNEHNFQEEILNKKGIALVDFWAPWCGPCRTMGPGVEKLAKDFAGRANIGKVNLDDNEALAASYEITAIPTFLILKDGEVVGRFVGAVTEEVLADRLGEFLDGVGEATRAVA